MHKYQPVLILTLLLFIAGLTMYFLRRNSDPVSLNIPFNQTFPSETNLDAIPADETVTLTFVGDIMLDRNIRLKAQQNGYDSLIGPELKNLLAASDYSIANLEGPVTSNQSVSVGSTVGSPRNFIFTFAPESLEFLKNHHFSIVNLGNNHILNFGIEGLSETYALLEQANIHYFGYTGPSQPEGSSVFILESDSYSIGFANYNQFLPGGEEQAFADLQTLRPRVDYLVLYTHWGNEYVQENQVIIDLAHRFVEAGADLIIGSHPHVVTGHEVYQDTHVYYSLGNFIFDQYFDPEVRRGQVVTAKINPKTKETLTTEQYVDLQPSGQTELVTTAE